MKKTVLFFFLGLASMLFSQELQSPFELSYDILKTGLHGNEAKLQQQAHLLTEIEKDMLFDAYKMDSGYSLVLRGGYGFGEGFGIMGNADKAKTFRILDTVSLAGFLVFGGSAALSLPFLPSILLSDDADIYAGLLLVGSITGATSVLVLLSSQTYQFVTLSTHASDFNKDLECALGVSDIALSALPMVDFQTCEQSVAVLIKIKI